MFLSGKAAKDKSEFLKVDISRNANPFDATLRTWANVLFQKSDYTKTTEWYLNGGWADNVCFVLMVEVTRSYHDDSEYHSATGILAYENTALSIFFFGRGTSDYSRDEKALSETIEVHQ